jgi:hypothetical protein
MATDGVDLMVNETSGDIRSSRSTRPVTGTLLRGLTFLLTIAIIIVGWRAHVPGGITAINAVALLITVVWALVGLVDIHDRESTPTRISPFHLLVGLDALFAAVALSAGRLALTHPDNSGGAARVVATIASLLVTAISFHLLLALPDGRLPGTARRGVVLVVYVLALGAGIALAVDHHTLSVRDGAVSWSLAAAVAIVPSDGRSPALRARPRAIDRQRLQMVRGSARWPPSDVRPWWRPASTCWSVGRSTAGRRGGRRHGVGTARALAWPRASGPLAHQGGPTGCCCWSCRP